MEKGSFEDQRDLANKEASSIQRGRHERTRLNAVSPDRFLRVTSCVDKSWKSASPIIHDHLSRAADAEVGGCAPSAKGPLNTRPLITWGSKSVRHAGLSNTFQVLVV
jgi:hypothetical protein